LLDAFVESLAVQIGPDRLLCQALPERVQSLQRGPYRLALNYRDEPLDVAAAPGSRFLVGSARIGPGEVAVWEEKDKPE
jgi:hypothetical protein